jgi:predicted hotdog family 3-hydroxylacyl-ACP dehydratase
MNLGRDAIARLLPHAGAMLLLDEVVDWDSESIACSTTSHQREDNPLRHRGLLPALAGIEYAAQAMAVHGALAAGGPDAPGRPGLLAAVRDVTLHVARLDDAASPMIVGARRLTPSGGRAIYSFTVEAAGRALLAGRATVVLITEKRQ